MTNIQPTEDLTDRAATKIEQTFPDEVSDDTYVIWWDDGGFLREIIEDAAEELGVGFRAAEQFPLELRQSTNQADDRPTVWYIGEAKAGRDWFRDIRETGGEITCGIEMLVAELYEVNPWEIFDRERHGAKDRADAAEIILRRFGTAGVPQYNSLKEEILTKGDGPLLDHLLRDGWPEIDRGAETVSRVRERLHRTYEIPVEDGQGPEEITAEVRRWAVAGTLVTAGLDPDALPRGYGTSGHNQLDEIVSIHGSMSLAEKYLHEEFWPSVVKDVTDVWTLVDCVVDKALDKALWDTWAETFAAGDMDTCEKQATQRQEALSVYPDESGWPTLWEQAAQLARLQSHFQDWADRDGSTDPFEIYTDSDEGSWRIDSEVLQLQVTGSPETALPTDHPAQDRLPEVRNELLTDRYRDYLETLAEETEAAIRVNPPFPEKDPAYEWWSDHEDDFDELGKVAVLFIDALRFDLAQRLAERLSDDFEVRRDTRLATLPTETKFGMAALTPGRPYSFTIEMDGGGLSVTRGERSLGTKSAREELLEDEGWSVPDAPDSGWEHHKIGYYEKDIDDVGEGEIGDIERHFGTYVEDLSAMISRKLDSENWDRIYVVTDHGFVLLPEGTTMEPVKGVDFDGAEKKFRRVAGDAVNQSGTGVYVESTMGGLDYLDTNLQVLIDPRQFYSKQGYSPDTRYYHGGLLPQECMLSFLEIQQ